MERFDPRIPPVCREERPGAESVILTRPGPQHRGLLVQLLQALVHLYRWLISPLLGPPRCRYVPSCSAYALEALEAHGAWRGSVLTLQRLLRCHPWGGSGFDPVPRA